MIDRTTFDAGLDAVLASFARNVKKQTVDQWYEMLSHRFTPGTWADACGACMAEDDSFPANFVKAMLSRAPRRRMENVVPIDSETGLPFTPEEAHANLERYRFLRLIAGDREHPRHKELVACGIASAREHDSPAARRKWGTHLEALLDQVRAAGGQGDAAA